MGSYHTLHVFDSKKYFEIVIPKMIRDESYLNTFLDSDEFKLFTFRDNKEELEAKEFQEFLKKLSMDSKRYAGNERTIPHTYYKLLEIIIFTECALFSPYFNLGYRAFSNLIQFTEKKSIAEELINKFDSVEDDSIFGFDSFGIKNWLTFEEVELLFLDLDKVIPMGDGEQYCKDFKILVTEVYQAKLGFIICRDPHFDYYCYVNNHSSKLQIFNSFGSLSSFVNIDCSNMENPLKI